MIKGNHSLQLGHPQDSSLEKLNAEFSVTWNKIENHNHTTFRIQFEDI